MSWDNFSRSEFACQCGCGANEIQDSHIDVIQDIRTEVGFPLVITSGYRCENHPIEARKRQPGEHSDGTASDVGVSRAKAFKVLKAAMAHPRVTAVGVNQKGGSRFLHISTGPAKKGRPRPTVWSY